ncbi:hypothetical protein DPMN_184775 [Dreissena polymorpha]|uniref:Uncharacterized protein n=1 Tax=Dreissena polymorpha TaxID=45954 RepID=A0A9D4DKN3_DREPO|nr:hypothetical protein DPMN_184775 [Dreissena polymorpha]
MSGWEKFMVENTKYDVELGELEYFQIGDIITISENNACDESSGYLDGETVLVSLKVWSSAPAGSKWKGAPPCHSEAQPFPSETPSCPCIY